MAPALDRRGFWGRPTSTLDWCEENYAVSFYIAEFWNTVSNLIMILPPICGAIQTFRDGLEFRYICSFLGLAAVGVGSWCFHMTLLYEMQLLDELPMIYSTCVFVYCLYECFKQENRVSWFPVALLFIFSVTVTAVYLEWKEPVFHQSIVWPAADHPEWTRVSSAEMSPTDAQASGAPRVHSALLPWLPDLCPHFHKEEGGRVKETHTHACTQLPNTHTHTLICTCMNK
ncbi:alkaline ceramidase 3 isoform X2 [Nerophis ophidion]|uniref:alkaline ceramidase 3 isoform X2 n=1 Tax=Nerophis ophidion TaxID=159077 RepID=UPI002ADFC2A4|nr:alkaline ceramidase 3 isoform X2 [Nerophis ophidion]